MILFVCIKLTELTSLIFIIMGHGSWWRLFKGGANLIKYGHAFNLVCLKSLDGTWQENPKQYSGLNPFQEPVLHIGDFVINFFYKK